MDEYSNAYSDRIKKAFSENLSHLMSKYSIQSVDLAKLAGVSQQTVSAWVNGHKLPRMKMLDKLCTILHCNRSDLLDEKQAYFKMDEKGELVFGHDHFDPAQVDLIAQSEELMINVMMEISKMDSQKRQTVLNYCKFINSNREG